MSTALTEVLECRRRGKIGFQTKDEAEAFEKGNREKRGYDPQRVYQCECGKFHLTSLEVTYVPGAPRLARVREGTPPPANTRDRVRDLKAQGLNKEQIALRLNCTAENVGHHLKNIACEDTGTPKPTRGSYFKKSLTLSDVETKRLQLKEAYEKQILELESETARIKRDELFNIIPDGAGMFMMRKHRERMNVTVETFKEMVNAALEVPALFAVIRAMKGKF